MCMYSTQCIKSFRFEYSIMIRMQANPFEYSSESERVPAHISEVAPIKESRNSKIRTREELKQFVETPLLKACEELYDKNIKTISTSANKNDSIHNVGGHVVIDFDMLSDENKRIGEQFGTVAYADGKNQLDIVIPMSEATTIKEIEDLAGSIAHRFKKQKMTWAPVWTMAELQALYGMSPDDPEAGPGDFAELFYYDEDSKLFYLSKEHAEKVHEKID